MRDVTSEVSFHCSSYKSGHHFFTTPLSEDVYWQTESGTLPHRLEIRFQKPTPIRQLHLLLDAIADESYCPKLLSVSAGSYLGGSIDVLEVEVPDGHQGWFVIDLGESIWCSFLAVSILENVLNGRDSRLRGIRVLNSMS